MCTRGFGENSARLRNPEPLGAFPAGKSGLDEGDVDAWLNVCLFEELGQKFLFPLLQLVPQLDVKILRLQQLAQ